MSWFFTADCKSFYTLKMGTRTGGAFVDKCPTPVLMCELFVVIIDPFPCFPAERPSAYGLLFLFYNFSDSWSTYAPKRAEVITRACKQEGKEKSLAIVHCKCIITHTEEMESGHEIHKKDP